jgi:flagellum-specific peptidoglycan hydrolase FlgJ
VSKATDFIKKITPYAEATERLYDVPAAFLIAQAGIESTWGSDATVPYNNVFGVKAFSNWKGKTVTLPADGGMAKFRWYDSLQDCFNEQGKLLTCDLYRPALAWKANLWHYANAVQKAGYCPNTKYADLVLAIAEDFQLIPAWKVEFEKAKARGEKSGILTPSKPDDLTCALTVDKMMVYLCRYSDKGGKI